jgi:DedD protein
MADPADVNVDDLRRRARRRLVGAIVLALGAAVFVPMLLESDPKPLGEDVSVRIPPVDDGKFVNRLNDASKAPSAKSTAPKTDSRSDMKPEPMKEPAKIEPPKAESPKAEAVTPAPATEPKAVAAAPAPVPPPPAASAPPPAPVVAAAANAPAQSEPSSAGFSVQLAAFLDDKGANSLTNKLKKAGYPAYTEPLVTTKGTLWRVRVGPYPSRDAAASSRDKLKGEGYSGIVAAAK